MRAGNPKCPALCEAERLAFWIPADMRSSRSERADLRWYQPAIYKMSEANFVYRLRISEVHCNVTEMNLGRVLIFIIRISIRNRDESDILYKKFLKKLCKKPKLKKMLPFTL